MCRAKLQNHTKIATFNVRGLNEPSKQNNLIDDLKKQKIEVCCLQETKINEDKDEELQGYRLINLKPDQKAYGCGFVISPRWKNNIYRYWKVSDRVSAIQFDMDEEKFESEIVTETKLRIRKVKHDGEPKKIVTVINVYGPQTGRLTQSIDELEEMYTHLNNLINETGKQRHLTFIAGDFNAKVGKRIGEDINCMGKFSRGITNNSGSNLIEFCEAHNLFMANTAFRHSARHITTWESRRTVNGEEIKIFNQIDYVICNQNIKRNLINARSYNGTTTDSDHRLVVATMDMRPFMLFPRKKPKRTDEKTEVKQLVNDEQARLSYQEHLDRRLAEIDSENIQWEELAKILRETSTETLNDERKITKQSDPIKIMSEKQKELRLRIENTENPERKAELKHKRNQILKEIRRKVREEKEIELDNIVEQIESANHSAEMYKAVKHLNKKARTPMFINEDGKRITDKATVHKRVSEFYEKRLRDDNIQKLEQFVGPPKPLEKPITTEEVKKCLAKMSNGKSPGHDNIRAELLKYGTDKLHQTVCNILNNVFEKHDNAGIGKGVIVPLQKPGKAKGIVKNLRPVTLLSVLRKLLSLITTNRTRRETERFVSPTQSAYRFGRGTTDVVWTFKWMLAKIQKYEIEYYVTGIDMTAAFDTIDRAKMIEIYGSITGEDEVRMVRALNTNTTLKIKIPEYKCADEFESNKGSPQGDGASGTNFNVYLEKSLQETRRTFDKWKEHDYGLREPNEMEYADDVDFIDTNTEDQQNRQEKIGDILAKSNLIVNDEKTEVTILKRGQRNEERWRKVKKLGSLLGDEEDMINRKNLASAALGKLQNLWRRTSKIRLEKRILLYNTLVKTILLYNSETWGMSKTQGKKLDAFHRQQLRKVMNIKYPNKKSNISIYNECQTEPLSLQILERRWRYFGHILRLSEDTPSWQAMKSYFDTKKHKKFKGRPRTTIVTTLNEDLNRMKRKNTVFDRNVPIPTLTTLQDLDAIKELAKSRPRWKNITSIIYAAAKADCSEFF
jgi:exonuclease III